jgi:hypothetical protein
MRIVDNIIALRILYLLVTPIENTDAFKLGLIDKDGKTVRKAVTSEEGNATSMLHRLVWNIKRLISLVPGGSTRLGSLAAGYLLVKESMEKELSNEYILEKFNEYSNIESINEEIESVLNGMSLLEDEGSPAIANTTGDMVSTTTPVKAIKKLVRRKLEEEK